MDIQTIQSYKQMLTEIMQKIIAVLGPQLAFALTKNIKSLTFAENGEVTAINGNPKDAAAMLIENITNLSQPLEKKVIQPILNRYLFLQPVSQTTVSSPVLDNKSITPSQQSNEKVDQ